MELWLAGLVAGLIVGYFFGRVHGNRRNAAQLDRLRRDYDELAALLEACRKPAP